jgi:DNA-binding transcriptional ArsR family regulator
MTNPPLHFELRQFGQVLATRRHGQDVARALAEHTARDRDVVLDFKDVVALTPPFLDAFFDAVTSMLSRHGGSTTVVATNLDDDLMDSIELVLEKRGSPLAWQQQDEVRLLAAAPHLRETLEAAAQTPEFTAADLAGRLNLRATTVNQRLMTLLEAGAVARQRDVSERGVRYRYRTPRGAASPGAGATRSRVTRATLTSSSR